MPVLDIIQIPPAPNSSGGCTRDSSLHARLSVVQISHILPRIVLATSKRVLYPVSSSTKLFQRSFRAARVCQVAASGAMCNNSRIHRTVKIYRSKIPHSGGMNAEGWKVARKLLDGAIWEIREEKRGKKLWNRSRIPSDWKENANVQTFLPLSIFPTIYASLFKTGDMNGWKGKVGFVVGYRTMTQSKFRLFCRYFF